MNPVTKIGELRERANAYWIARTAQERTFLAVGAAVVVLALLWAVKAKVAQTVVQPTVVLAVRLVQQWVKACLVVILALPLVVPSAVAQALQLKNVNNVLSSNFQKKALHGSAFFIAVRV